MTDIEAGLETPVSVGATPVSVGVTPIIAKSADSASASRDASIKEQPAPLPAPDIQAPSPLPLTRFMPIYIGLMLGVFIISLDNTVVATAQIPIVKDLGGSRLVSWLPTSFLIAQGAFALFWGQTLGSFPSKYIFLLNVFLFELGSLVSAVAPNIAAVLAGRAVSGIGAAGMMSGAIQILIETTTIQQRAVYVGLLGALFAIAMIAGPLIGGALASVTWRWVFWINLPIGGVAFITNLLLTPARPPLGTNKSKPTAMTARLRNLDVVGCAILTVGMCALVIPISEAYQTGWSSWRIWLPIALAFPILASFYAWVCFIGDGRAVIPRTLLHDINLLGCVGVSFAVFWNAILFMYLIPYYYQVVEGHSATKSGVDMLALMITLAIGSVASGVVAKKTGHYWPQVTFFPLLGAIGAGISTLNSSTGIQIGSQILLGAGTGLVIQGPMLIVQANTDKRLVSKATSLVIFGQRFGGGMGSSISSAILAAQLPGAYRRFLPAGVDPEPYYHIDATQILSLPADEIRAALLNAVTWVVHRIYLVGVPLFVVITLLMLTMVKATNIKTNTVVSKRSLLLGKGARAGVR
ncbi:unnamed protein product [Jaminaea pallidilutea]